MRGTATSTEMRSRRIRSVMRAGSNCSAKWTSAASSAGHHSPMNWPKTWLSGSECRKRSGWKIRSTRAYFAISRSIGSSVTSTLRCVCTMPRGSDVVPEVNTI